MPNQAWVIPLENHPDIASLLNRLQGHCSSLGGKKKAVGEFDIADAFERRRVIASLFRNSALPLWAPINIPVMTCSLQSLAVLVFPQLSGITAVKIGGMPSTSSPRQLSR